MFGSKKNVTVRIEFPTKQILKLIFILALIFLSVKLHEVIILVFLSFILMASIKPAVTLMYVKFKIPKGLSIAIIYLLIIVLITISIYFISKPLASEVKKFADTLPSIIQNSITTFPFLDGKVDPNVLGESIKKFFTGLSTDFSNLGNALQNALSLTFTAFGLIIHFITVIIISIYLLLDRENILNFIIKAFRLDKMKFLKTYEKIESQLGAWIRGQLFLGLIVGVTTWIGLTILGIKFALPLAVLAGMLEIVPIIGPILTAIPIAIIGFSMSPVKGLLSLGLSTLIQQVEGHFLVPGVMKRAVGLSPVVTLISLLIGSRLLGLVGSIIAVPLAAMFSVLIQSYLETRDSELD
jgi:predicted PurR-regulated permease PerM